MNEENNSMKSTQEDEHSFAGDDNLAAALESTLEELNQSLEQMEKIIERLETNEWDWEESVRLIAKANQLAVASSQKLDRMVQGVVLSSGGRTVAGEDEEDGEQQSLELP